MPARLSRLRVVPDRSRDQESSLRLAHHAEPAETIALLSEDAETEAVEGADPEPGIRGIQKSQHPLAELGRGAARERQRQDAIRRDTVFDEVGKTPGQCPRLAGPCPGHNLERTVRMCHHGELIGIQSR